MTIKADKIRKMTAVSSAQLQRWITDGLIKPSIPAAGPGFHRGYDERNVAEIVLIKEMFSRGLKTDILKKVLDLLRDNDEGSPSPLLETIGPGRKSEFPPVAERLLVIDGSGRIKIFLRDFGDTKFELDPFWKSCIIFNLTRVGVDAALIIDHPPKTLTQMAEEAAAVIIDKRSQ